MSVYCDTEAALQRFFLIVVVATAALSHTSNLKIAWEYRLSPYVFSQLMEIL